MKPDLRDVSAFIGLALMGVGAWLIVPAAGFLLVGSLLFVGGVWGVKR